MTLQKATMLIADRILVILIVFIDSNIGEWRQWRYDRSKEILQVTYYSNHVGLKIYGIDMLTGKVSLMFSQK